ncbi:MFS drug transporter [Phanerochaete sordida]|uniref:MFS drug transporter n=1 Tax=Phanerochaete sordida TaxID=48140 RepID=A0A9P3G8X9_9APHY|nr:MFS drug transporter [Phanerochaete sordida]
MQPDSVASSPTASEPADSPTTAPASAPATADTLTDQTNYLPRRKIISVFLACATVSITGLLDETMVAVALPIMSSDFNAGSQISWVANAFFVTSTSFQLTYGRLSDIWARKATLLVLMLIFFIGNVASSVSKTFIELLVFRAIAGIGGGGLPTIAQVIVSDVVSLRERGKYQGILGISVAFANGVGPVIGGVFASHVTWRWIFWLTLPMTVVSAIMVWFFMPLKPVEGDWRVKVRRVDWLGVALILASSTLIVLSLTWAGSEYSWDSPHVLVTLILGLAIAAAFVVWEWKGPRFPLLPLRIFKNSIVVGAAITQFINGFLTMVQVFYLPTFYQMAYGYSPTKSGAMLLPLTVVQTFTSTFSGLIVTWTGRYRELILIGWAMWSIGLGLLATLKADSPIGKQIGYSILTGIGIGQTFQPSLVAVQGALERKDMAVVTAMRSFARNLGGTIGLAIAGTMINNVLSSRLHSLPSSIITPDQLKAIVNNPVDTATNLAEPLRDDVIDAYRQGFRDVFILLAVLAAFAFFVAAALLKHRNLDRDDDKDLREQGLQFVKELKAAKSRPRRAGDPRKNAAEEKSLSATTTSEADGGRAEKP